MIAKMCFILLTGLDGSVLINSSTLQSAFRARRCTDHYLGAPTYVVVGTDGFCVRESPEEVLGKINKECK